MIYRHVDVCTVAYTTCPACGEVLNACNNDRHGDHHPNADCHKKCCHRDSNMDGNCSIHRGRGVLRNPKMGDFDNRIVESR